MRLPLGALSTGTYYLSVSGSIAKTGFDGGTAVKPGPWLTVTDCVINVT